MTVAAHDNGEIIIGLARVTRVQFSVFALIPRQNATGWLKTLSHDLRETRVGNIHFTQFFAFRTECEVQLPSMTRTRLVQRS